MKHISHWYTAGLASAFLICVSTFAPFSSFAVSDQFPFFHDVPVDHPNFSAVTRLLHEDMIQGYPDGSFQIDKAVSRAEAMKIILEASNISTSVPATHPFVDVDKSEWFAPYVHTAKSKRIISGDGVTGLFSPERTVNKAEAVKIILNANNISVPAAQNNEEWYTPFFSIAMQRGIITNMNNAEYQLTRGDMAKLMYQNMLYTENKRATLFSGDNELFHAMNLSITDNTISEPENISAEYIDGRLKLSWDSTDANNMVITARQKNIIVTETVTGAEKIFEPLFWKRFSKGDIHIALQKMEGGMKGQPAYLTIPAFERFTESYSSSVIGTNIDWEYAESLNASISMAEEVSNAKGYVLTSDNQLFEKPVQTQGSSIDISFTPQKKDFYVLEITDEAGIALAVMPITPKGYFPILPNFLDQITQGTVGSQSSLINRINTFRAAHGKSRLTEKEELNALALVRVHDMIEQNYFGHVSPQGVSAQDLRSDFSIQSNVGENIASSSQGALQATVGLEYSPTHRSLLLSEDFSFVGIETRKNSEGQHIVVEIFQETPLSQNDIDTGMDDLYSFIAEQKEAGQKSDILENIAQQWSDTMAEKNSLATDMPDGQSWKNLIDDTNIMGDTSIFVLSHGSPQDMISFFENDISSLSNVLSGKNQYGIGLSLSSEGIVYLCILTTQ